MTIHSFGDWCIRAGVRLSFLDKEESYKQYEYHTSRIWLFVETTRYGLITNPRKNRFDLLENTGITLSNLGIRQFYPCVYQRKIDNTVFLSESEEDMLFLKLMK